MRYNFERFGERLRGEKGNPTVSLSKHGNMVFNKDFVGTFVNDKPHVSFFFDRIHRVIGIKFINKKEPSAYKVTKYKSGNGAIVCCPSFLKFFHILPNESYACKAKWSKSHKMVTIRLQDKTTPTEIDNRV